MASSWTTALLVLLAAAASLRQSAAAVSMVASLGDMMDVMVDGSPLEQKKGEQKEEKQEQVEPLLPGSGSGSVVTVPFATLPIAGVLIAAVIGFIYAPHGLYIVVSVLVYVGALSMMKLTVKWVFITHHFPFAKFLSGLHFASGALVMGLLLLMGSNQQSDGAKKKVPIPTVREFGLMILPIALSVVLSIGSNNMALLTCSAAFTEIVGATNCLITIGTVIAMGMPFEKTLILPVLVVAFGCGLATTGEINFSLAGTLLCLMANVFRSLKVSLQQKLMTGETKDKFDPCALLFWICLPSVAVMMALSLATEGLAPYRSLAAPVTSCSGLLVAIGVSCVNATILNLAQLFVTKHLGAVGSQLVAQAKMVLTVLGGMILFGESMTQIEVFGFALVLAGVYQFSRMEQMTKEKDKEGKRAETATSFGALESPTEKTRLVAKEV